MARFTITLILALAGYAAAPIWILALVALAGNVCAVDRPNLSLEERVAAAELVAVVDAIEPIPYDGKEFDKFYRVSARVAGVLKGDAKVSDRIEVVVDGTISEHRNDCCEAGKSYVVFLREREGRYLFVGSPLGAVPLKLQPHD
ncbi:hypothetical protein QFW77_00915 [Luteimonas sp. RD2P54]|uniref:Uncharacterized protein n=1 Tax=Luteimonas endophytica TaxID=3042023 RepID=A0ABT6J407_9GAMM|nr:hypothetical protein [Luteimonas endophytica]MDH5821556.1 hypothetical protein [Luteimonas endophytica]